MFLIPYRLDISYTDIPFTNAIIIALTTLFYIGGFTGFIPEDVIEAMVLRDWNFGGMLGNLFLHGGVIHLLGNMIFLWVFGNAICSTVGNIPFIFLYLVLGVFADCAHLLFNGQPAIGASGAINGVVGMALVFFPKNDLNCFYVLWLGFWAKAGKFAVKSFWMIGLWFIFDVFGMLFGGDHVAYWAHIGGFIAGVSIAMILLQRGVVQPFDPTILDVLANRDAEKPTSDLNELARRAHEKKKARSLDVLLKQHPDVGSLRAIPGRSKAIDKLEDEPIPVFRLVSIADKDIEVVLYIVNDGDTVGDIVLAPQDPFAAEIHPRELFLRGTSGWIKIHKGDRALPKILRFSVSYRGGFGSQFTNALTYHAEEKRIVLK